MSKKTLPKLLREAKESNIPRRNCMEMKKELAKSIADTQHRYKDITLRRMSKRFENFYDH